MFSGEFMIKLLAIISLSLTLAACSSAPKTNLILDVNEDQKVLSIDELMELRAEENFVELNDDAKGIVKGFDLKVMQKEAYKIGLLHGQYWRALEIEKLLETQKVDLMQSYNFGMFMYGNGKILSPVVIKVEGQYDLISDNESRESSYSLTMIQEAKQVSRPPSYMDYLMVPKTKPKSPNSTLLPYTEDQIETWKSFIVQGWNDGAKQANEIFEIGRRRLERDFSGMILARELIRANVISEPTIQTGKAAVTKSGNTLHIRDVRRFLKDKSEFQEYDDWRPLVR